MHKLKNRFLTIETRLWTIFAHFEENFLFDRVNIYVGVVGITQAWLYCKACKNDRDLLKTRATLLVA